MFFTDRNWGRISEMLFSVFLLIHKICCFCSGKIVPTIKSWLLASLQLWLFSIPVGYTMTGLQMISLFSLLWSNTFLSTG
ncbi:unnamed protein product [Brassica rapa subsp. trilocularis]